MYIKYILVLMIVIVFGLLFFNNGKQYSDEPLTGLPWQIDRLADGDTRVFGITPGQTTLAGALQQLGDDLDLAIIAAPHESGTLEAYYSHYSAGPITGKLLLVMNITADELSALRERAYQDGGTRRYHLHPDDLAFAYRTTVRVINFMPDFNLDEDISEHPPRLSRLMHSRSTCFTRTRAWISSSARMAGKSCSTCRRAISVPTVLHCGNHQQANNRHIRSRSVRT